MSVLERNNIMPTFTPRTTKEGMSSPSSPYNDIHYVGGLTTNHNPNKYNYNNVIIKLLINIKLLYKENDMFENLDLYKENKKMGSKEFIELCINTVVDYFNNRSNKTDDFVITEN